MEMGQEKVCIACGQPIRNNSKKCPHCRAWQYRLYTACFHPATWGTLVLLVGGMLLFPMTMLINDISQKGVGEASLSKSIQVVESNLHFSEKKDGRPFISCIGKLRNTSDVSWSSLHFVLTCFNSSSQLVDTLADHDYALVLGPRSEVAFRVRGQADKTSDQYVTHKLEVVSARQQGRFD